MIARILFDGLWQGALVAAVALAVVRAVPSRDATTRYAIWFAALLALVAVPILAALSTPARSCSQPHGPRSPTVSGPSR